jgi:ankyrin repeat protein
LKLHDLHLVLSLSSLQGWTALMVAAANGHLEVVTVLLAAGADASIKAKDVCPVSCFFLFHPGSLDSFFTRGFFVSLFLLVFTMLGYRRERRRPVWRRMTI